MSSAGKTSGAARRIAQSFKGLQGSFGPERNRETAARLGCVRGLGVSGRRVWPQCVSAAALTKANAAPLANWTLGPVSRFARGRERTIPGLVPVAPPPSRAERAVVFRPPCALSFSSPVRALFSSPVPAEAGMGEGDREAVEGAIRAHCPLRLAARTRRSPPPPCFARGRKTKARTGEEKQGAPRGGQLPHRLIFAAAGLPVQKRELVGELAIALQPGGTLAMTRIGVDKK